MASASVDSPSDRLQLESIATVDLRLLSQSELYALSLCSDGAFDPHRCDDVVIPKIDRSVFNESAGSRKQTYSRLRLAPRKPESSAAAATIIPRRTPHLRIPKSASNTADYSDPERAENSKIVAVLKELFAPETNGDDLVPIRVEYSDSVPQLPNVGNNLVKKRKRGRPRKNENLTVVAAAAEAAEVEVQSLQTTDHVIKDIVVYETTVEDRDKEIVNKNGNVVDLATLGSLEDPYGPELQRRTEDLKTEDELLGFLRGLNGQWGSRRKKKKIVDASEFGDALPKGWKILLSLKKKEGRVWLFVRRYISPNGRQFVSSMEVSSYLLSFGFQDVNQPNCVQNNDIQMNYKFACGNSADFAIHSPSVITCVSNDHEKQVTSEVANSGEIETGDILKCDKCPLTFEAKDDLLQHQLSSHRRKRSRFGTSITDGVIIKGGQYECQFCHKTFNERNRYNGHVGAHIRHHMKSDEASLGVLSMQNSIGPLSPGVLSMQNSIGLLSSGGVPPIESMMQTSIGDGSDAVIVNAKADSDLKLVSPQGKFKASSDIESYTDNNDQKCGNSYTVNAVLTSVQAESKQKRGSETVDGETCGVKDVELKLDAIYNNGNKEVMIGCGSGHSGRDEDAVTGVEQENSESSLLVPSWKRQLCDIEDNESAGSACTMEEFGQEKGSEGSLPILSGYEQTCDVKNDVGNVSTRKMEPKLGEVQTYGNKEHAFGISHSRLNTKERSLEFCSRVLSGNEQTFNVEENETGVCNSTEKPSKQESSFDSGSITQSCTGKTFGDVYIMNRGSEPKPDEVRNSSNGGLILSFGNNGAGMVGDVMNSVPIEQTFSFETNLSRENNRAGKDPKQETGLLGPSFYAKTCGEENNLNRIHTGRVWEGPMIDGIGNSGHDKLTISFGCINAQPDGDIMPGSVWRTGGENVLQSTLADTSTQQEQSSSCFSTFSIVSDKGEHELLNGKYDSMSDVERAQSGHTDHVEFSFLTTQNLNQLPGDSKALSYDPEMGQGFDSLFWLEKDALSLNIAARSQVTTVCVWCRNEFHHEPVHTGTQTGAIGSICPTCSAKVSEQFNFF